METALALDLCPERWALADAGAVRRPCVVLAEDDREMRMLVATTLRRAGWDVIEAGDGIDLLDCIAWVIESRDDGRDCVLVSDIRMPGLSGLDALERLRDVGWHGAIILITAFGDEATHARARELGASMVLDKPFDLDALCDAIRGVQRS
jgi:DNA-binding response OmpR family regulator